MSEEKVDRREMLKFLKTYQKGFEEGMKYAFEYSLKVVEEWLEENE